MRYALPWPWAPILLLLPFSCLPVGASSGHWFAQWKGASDTLAQFAGFPYRKTVYGPNVISIPVKSYLQLLVDEVKDPGVTHSSLSE